jgi:DNA-binding NtrC family response regulator
VPPLRERREEIPHLSSLFLREASERLGKPDVYLMRESLDLFSQYWWPGNVRQLRNEVQRAVALGQPGKGIGPEHLSPEIVAPLPRDTAEAPRLSRPRTTLAIAVSDLEREMIQASLHSANGNIAEAARVLGLTRRGLYLKLKRLGFEQRPGTDSK